LYSTVREGVGQEENDRGQKWKIDQRDLAEILVTFFILSRHGIDVQ
jgi:hypothetical protein